jgi:hypothetical protein
MPKSRHRKKTGSKRSGSHFGYDSRIGVMRLVAHFPIRECLINDDWKESLMASVIIARDHPDGQVAVAAFAVDLGCLGVKSAFANHMLSASDYQRMLSMQETHQIPVDPACAVKLITGALEYAKQFGFKPDPDYFYSRAIFGDIDPASCHEDIEYGKDGKPLYIAGPYDNVKKIINQLGRKVGPDGFDYIIPFGPLGDVDDEDEEGEDDLD